MALTAAQLSTLKAHIAANTATINGVQIKDIPYGNDNNIAIAAWYNLTASPDFWGNYSAVPLSTIRNAITFKNYTPADAVPTSDALAATIHMARTLFCQAFQLSVNNLFVGGANSFDATKATLVASLKDATNTNMPSGVAGADRKGGWSDVQTILCRLARNTEKVLADTSAANGSSNTLAATFTFEGTVNVNDIENARNSP